MANDNADQMKSKEPIPTFASREQEAEFWDSHDLADYWDDFEPAKVRFSRNLTEGITIRFDPATLAKLRAEAKKRGLGATSLARMWILERLRQT